MGDFRGKAHFLICVYVGLSLASSSILASEKLSALALLSRCYSHLTGGWLSPQHPLRSMVLSGQITPVDACITLVDSAELRPSDGRLRSDSPEARSVLRTFNDFHRSWFSADNFTATVPFGECSTKTRTLHDNAEGALHISRALFLRNTLYSEIVTGDSAMEALRTSGPIINTAATMAKEPGSSAMPGVVINVPMVQTGELIGISPIKNNPDKRSVQIRSPHAPFPFNLHESLGGGMLGTKSYLILNLGRPDYYPFDGGAKLPRRWSRAIASDLLCRNLPLIRLSDAEPFIQTSVGPNTPPFRTGRTCMGCHASIDPMAMIARNLVYGTANPEDVCDNKNWTTHVIHWPESRPRETGYVDRDPEFHQRPPHGKLLFRSYTGTLVSREVRGIAALGSALSETKDLYACAASRYFYYFTGIQVPLFDPGDPASPSLSRSEKEYRDLIIRLGDELKKHQSLKQLIRRILETDIYQHSSLRSPNEAR